MVEINEVRLQKSTARKELIGILFLGILIVYFAYSFDFFEFVSTFVEQHEVWEVDKIFLLLAYSAIALTFFSIRRWQEAKNEIEKRKDLEKQLVYSAHKADSANRAKSEFLANMSHEIRTPLNAIIGFSDLLLEGSYGELNEKQTRYVRNMASSGKHLLELINQILDISKIESGNMKLHLETFYAEDILEEIKTMLHPLAAKKNIKVTFGSNEALEEITADKLKLKQIIFNLASNAVKFTPENGHVDINATISNGILNVKVADTGIGIKKTELNIIFEPFEQVEQMKNKKHEGTGLGLSIVKEFVELHQGRIWVESQVQIGSTFIFEIPVKLHA